MILDYATNLFQTGKEFLYLANRAREKGRLTRFSAVAGALGYKIGASRARKAAQDVAAAVIQTRKSILDTKAGLDEIATKIGTEAIELLSQE
jgi:hypothetical protein